VFLKEYQKNMSSIHRIPAILLEMLYNLQLKYQNENSTEKGLCQ